jgi:transposase
MTTWIGIDVSRLQLDAGWIDEDGKKVHKRVSNSQKGFAALLQEAPATAHFIMEATGTYYFNLALFLHQAGRFVAVVNPAQIKGFLKSELSRSKSDKSDSFSIAKFGGERRPSAWNPLERDVYELRQLLTLDDKLQHQIVELGNLEEAFSAMAYYSPVAILKIRDLVYDLKCNRAQLQAKMELIADKLCPREVEVIGSIPGVGKASAIRVAAAVGDFTRFETSRQLVSFLGLSPTLKQSGTSVKSKGHISRMGGSRVRGALYMCAMNALRRNSQCRAMWNRMKAKGKHGKVIMVAIMSKLIRQMWSMVTSNQVYNPNFA